MPILAKFRVPVSPVLFFEILRGHIASPPRAKIGQALSPCERELVLINNVLTSAIKATKKELFIGTLHALSSVVYTGSDAFVTCAPNHVLVGSPPS